MKRLVLFSFIFFLNFLMLNAHPGISIVQDSKGNIFYSDLTHVWKISPDDELSIAVEDVHTHQLHLDADDNLYGEHIWYEGEATDKWGHRIWCLKSNGELIDIVPSTEGFPVNNKLKKDKFGNEFYQQKEGEYDVLMKRSQDGSITKSTTHQFRDIRWICTDAASDDVLIVDHLSLKRVDRKGKVELITDKLKERSIPFFGVSDRHYIMGAWKDDIGDYYVAVYGAKKVKKITSKGKVEEILKSKNGWSPTGGFFDENQSLWLLEYSKRNKARVRRIRNNGESTVFQNK